MHLGELQREQEEIAKSLGKGKRRRKQINYAETMQDGTLKVGGATWLGRWLPEKRLPFYVMWNFFAISEIDQTVYNVLIMVHTDRQMFLNVLEFDDFI